jgi:hypothetical protein
VQLHAFLRKKIFSHACCFFVFFSASFSELCQKILSLNSTTAPSAAASSSSSSSLTEPSTTTSTPTISLILSQLCSLFSASHLNSQQPQSTFTFMLPSHRNYSVSSRVYPTLTMGFVLCALRIAYSIDAEFMDASVRQAVVNSDRKSKPSIIRSKSFEDVVSYRILYDGVIT